MCMGGGKPKSPPKPAEPLKDVETNMLEARDDAAKRMQAAAGYSAANVTKGKLAGSSPKLGGGSKLGGAV